MLIVAIIIAKWFISFLVHFKNRLCGQVHAVFTANLIRKAGQPTLASAKIDLDIVKYV